MYKNNIKAIRTGIGATQSQIAKQLHISQSALAKIERSDTPPIDIVFALAELFSVPVTQIYSKM